MTTLARIASWTTVLLASMTAAWADEAQVCYTLSLPYQAPTPAPITLNIPALPPSVGALIGVDVTITTDNQLLLGLENQSTFVYAPYLNAAANADLTRPGQPLSITYLLRTSFAGYIGGGLNAFDGVLDFAGPSGMSQWFTGGAANLLSIPQGSPDLAFFVGTGTIQPQLYLWVWKTGPSTGVIPGQPHPHYSWLANVLMRTDISVCYRYRTAGVAACSGDGTGTACPCGNAGASGHGCANSANSNGAALIATGNPSVSADTFDLQISGLPPNAPVLFFAGTSLTGGGLGVPFGDGLRCVSGSIVRLATRGAVGGVAHFGPSFGDATISSSTSIPATGGSFAYQAWYRNPASFCTPLTFNLTNAWVAGWSS